MKKKMFFFIYKKLIKNGVKIFKNISNPANRQKKRLLAHCFDFSKPIISHLFWFERDVLDNILTTAKNYITLPFSDIFTSNWYESFFNKYFKRKTNRWYLYSFSQKKWLNFSLFLPFTWVSPLKQLNNKVFHVA